MAFVTETYPRIQEPQFLMSVVVLTGQRSTWRERLPWGVKQCSPCQGNTDTQVGNNRTVSAANGPAVYLTLRLPHGFKECRSVPRKPAYLDLCGGTAVPVTIAGTFNG